MALFGNKQAELHAAMKQTMSAHLEPGENLVGLVTANQQKVMSANLFIIAVTDRRLVLQPTDKKWSAKGAPFSIAPGDVTGCSVWGHGAGLKGFLSMSADQQIRIETAAEKYKFMVLGGNFLENALAGDGQLSGLEALVNFLAATER